MALAVCGRLTENPKKLGHPEENAQPLKEYVSTARKIRFKGFSKPEKMIVGYQYLAMTITGVFHLVIGAFSFIASLVSFSVEFGNYYYYSRRPSTIISVTALFISLWVILVGVFGILAGLKSNSEIQTRRMKITYMVLAILSAVLFSLGGMTVHGIFASWCYNATACSNLHPMFVLGSLVMFAEFVLAIVSSSICCCCSKTQNSVVVVTSNQSTEFVNPSINH
ncbi:uncharacterized protein LOC115216985 [Argonauta hians]